MTRNDTWDAVETKVRQSFVDKLQMNKEEAKKIHIERAHRLGNSVGEDKSIVGSKVQQLQTQRLNISTSGVNRVWEVGWLI